MPIIEVVGRTRHLGSLFVQVAHRSCIVIAHSFFGTPQSARLPASPTMALSSLHRSETPLIRFQCESIPRNAYIDRLRLDRPRLPTLEFGVGSLIELLSFVWRLMSRHNIIFSRDFIDCLTFDIRHFNQISDITFQFMS